MCGLGPLESSPYLIDRQCQAALVELPWRDAERTLAAFMERTGCRDFRGLFGGMGFENEHAVAFPVRGVAKWTRHEQHAPVLETCNPVKMRRQKILQIFKRIVRDAHTIGKYHVELNARQTAIRVMGLRRMFDGLSQCFLRKTEKSQTFRRGHAHRFGVLDWHTKRPEIGRM